MELIGFLGLIRVYNILKILNAHYLTVLFHDLLKRLI